MAKDSFVQEFPESSNCRLFICVSIRICIINAIVMRSAYRDKILGRRTLEAFGLHPHPNSTKGHDISSCRTQPS